MIFAFTAVPGPQEWQPILLAESVRQWGGALANSDILALYPQAMGTLTAETTAKLKALAVEIMPFAGELSTLRFPFAAKVLAAAQAEEAAAQAAQAVQATRTTQAGGQLVWLDRDSLLIQEPQPLLLDEATQLGYRPVDHTLIGSRYEQPPDPFWQLLYARCGVEATQLWPMMTSVDEVRIRPYFNAGMLVVKPESGLLRSWRDDFLRLYQEPDFAPFYAQDGLYRIFMHQAVLAGVILRELEATSCVELPHLVNYPLHMHAQYPAARRPATMNELISGRYDTFFDDANWAKGFPMQEPLASWLRQNIGQYLTV
ncbi:MAG: hypothetical protein R3E31_12525 [Chloroflexota bacterium]